MVPWRVRPSPPATALRHGDGAPPCPPKPTCTTTAPPQSRDYPTTCSGRSMQLFHQLRAGTLQVTYHWSGFLAPALYRSGQHRQGGRLPVKFQLTDANGVSSAALCGEVDHLSEYLMQRLHQRPERPLETTPRAAPASLRQHTNSSSTTGHARAGCDTLFVTLDSGQVFRPTSTQLIAVSG